MGNCTLPATGGSIIVIMALGVLSIAAGIIVVRLGRQRALPVVVAVSVAVGVLVWAVPARASSNCPTTTTTPPTTATTPTTTTTAPPTTTTTVPPTTTTTTVPPTTSTTTTTTSTTTTSTTTTSTTSTTTAVPLRAPIAVDDDYAVAIGQSVTGNMLANDDLGNPPGTVTLVIWVGGSVPPGTPAVQPLGSLTMQADGSFVFENTGIPAGSRIFYNYRLTNSVGTSTGVVSFSGA